ncbi:MAG: peptidoglycan editing factor PgeF [Polyangiaceae bacterium]|jgi:YfiH family protein|nr:peptidoglycan editing factor PgeF [Polyangiaceae bacterium]
MNAAPVVSPLPRLSSPLLTASGFAHGFFTRRGGVSEGPFGSLNTAASVGDDPALVGENVARIETALGLPPGRLYYASQVHGVDVVRASASEPRARVLEQRADAVVSTEAGVGCGVRSADCGTVLVGDRKSGAALAIHAGWRGTALGVVAAGLDALRALVGAGADLVAAIGPHIEVCCFEVGDDVAGELASCSSLGDAAVDRSRARPHVDLRSILEAQLTSAGLAAASVSHVRGCTVCDAEAFFSFRRDGARSGRLMSAIVPRPSR